MTDRRPRADSLQLAQDAVRRTLEGFQPPRHLQLSGRELELFHIITRARSDWREHELIGCAHLAQSWTRLADLDEIWHREGAVIGTTIHPAFVASGKLLASCLAMHRSLQIHALAQRGDARRAARLPVAPTLNDPDNLLAT